MTTLFNETLDEQAGSDVELTVMTACAIDPITGNKALHLSNPHQRIEQLANSQRPKEVDFILSALEAAHLAPEHDRRSQSRKSIRTTADLQLYSDRPGAAPRELYTRDASSRSMGFISKHRLPLGYGGRLLLQGPHGEDLDIACTVIRCQQTVNGWYEGSMSFNREQFAFDLCNSTDAD